LADEETIKKQYKKLVLQTHPDKKNSICANGAFKLISDAWTMLSDTRRRIEYDKRRSMCAPQVHQSNYNADVDDTSTSSMSSVNGFWHQNSIPDGPRKVPPHLVHKVLDTFCTYCGSCFMNFQYSREYVNQHLNCPACQAVFVDVEVPPPRSPIYPSGQN
jgi:curved DNA-binding protein CbpA